MRELIEMLGFWIDRSGATAVLREVGGGCHPATRSELALWDALEAAREDAARWRHARRILTVEDIEASQDMFNAFGVEGDEHENRKADAAIDQARGKENWNG